MPEGRVSQIVAKGYGLCQRLIEPQRPGYGPGNLGYLQRMSKPGSVVIPLRIQKYLGLVLHPAECLAVEDPIPIPLILRPYVAERLLPLSALRIPA